MLKNLLKLLFPDICSGCGSLLIKNERVICTACRHTLPRTYHHQSPEQNEIHKKFYGLLPLEFSCSFLYFTHKNNVKELIHNLKYRNKTAIGKELGMIYSSDIRKVIEKYHVDCIVPVPLHPKRLKERGYNQIETFAKTIAETCKVDYNPTILYRKTYSKTQTKKNKESRQMDKRNVFAVQYNKENEGKHYLLIDDVLTTGATLESCGNALLEIPNTKISILTIAYTLS